MSKIEIKERDLTSAGNINATTSAVYIPGYANDGPINQPTLCESLNDFYSIFGSDPYKFRNTQYWPGELVGTGKSVVAYSVGDFEKSYIMAVQLLKLGMPVWYERVFDVATTNNLDNWTPYL
jgi:hypothetical protein